ncbi:MAG: tol-pal system-associated acyl-CoA thioesterase [Alphaproteobacteria bacterium]|nr:tol-pal system-associated acyl-CoA thioesterase [Alphaproteobacteria bacterium]
MTESPLLPHRFQVRVYYEDTDAAGIVYYANYLRFTERARSEFLRAAGFDHQLLREKDNLFLAVRRVSVDYKAPARLDDLLVIETTVVEDKNSSFTMRQIVRRGDDVLVEANVQIVAVNALSSRAVRIPPSLRQIFGTK